MILALLLAQANPVPAPPAVTSTPARAGQGAYAACRELAAKSPAEARKLAARLSAASPVVGKQCEGLAWALERRWAEATAAFAAGADAAESRRDGRSAYLRVQAANAALAGGDAAAAVGHLDKALAQGLVGEMAGEAHLDRARARAATGDMEGARADVDKAVALIPDSPLGWLLSATLARRMGDVDGAEHDIAEALARAPESPDVALEAGYIALMAKAPGAARTAFEAAVRNGPDTAAGQAAKAALAGLPPR